MKSSSRPPPRDPPPLTSDEMAVIKKKVAPPKGPPPAGLANFKAPRKYDGERDQDRHRHGYSDDIYGDEDMNRRRHNHRRGDNNDGITTYSRRPYNNSYDDKSTMNASPHSDEDVYKRQTDDDSDRDYHHSGYQNDPLPIADSKVQRTHFFPDNDNKLDSSHLHSSHPAEEDKSTLSQSKASNERDKIFNFRRILRASFKELRSFVTSPCEPKVVVRCYIERNKSGSNYLSPVYSLCADLEDGTGRELIICRKVFKSRTAHYVFSLKSEDLYRKREQRSRYYLGKLRAVSNTEYVVYDNGVCDTLRRTETNDTEMDTLDEPERDSVTPTVVTTSGVTAGDDESSLYRSHLAAIQFNSRVRPVETGERGMEVSIPYVAPVVFSPSGLPSHPPHPSTALKSIDLVECFRKIRETGRQNDLYASKCFVMHEKRSRYDPLSSCLVDFQGRATVASVKNFQLIHSPPMNTSHGHAPRIRPDDDIILQMGKITDECFNMDFKYPLSMLQAFAIAISRFDAQLTW